ncbi:MAG: hypothetical protein JNM39_07495 [Bdellovibrionaceae bacterium]|nr:hypothetical protein [Pseudobdellovibrionaceae bacterium]
MRFKSFVFILAIFLSSCASVPQFRAVAASNDGCLHDSGKQKLRSEEIQALAKSDQLDRQSPMESINWSKVLAQDELRRKRIGEIFGEGCLTSADDYSAAALIYQHGIVPDHYFQAFLWSKKAFELGNSWEGHSIANGIDRYLVSIGYKQIFGTQFSQGSSTKLWCIEPIEESFPESKRVQYLKKNLKESIGDFLKFYNFTQTSDDVPSCNHSLKASPAGTVPGFW